MVLVMLVGSLVIVVFTLGYNTETLEVRVDPLMTAELSRVH